MAVAMVGQLQWELIEPRDNEGIYARFLAEKGGGVHHIAVTAQSFDEMLADAAKRGTDVILNGGFGHRRRSRSDPRNLQTVSQIVQTPLACGLRRESKMPPKTDSRRTIRPSACRCSLES